MIQRKSYYGFVFLQSKCEVAQKLDGNGELIAFLKEHLFDEEVRVTDSTKKRLHYRSLNGVDVLSELDRYGISLPRIFEERRREITQETQAPCGDRQIWEDDYDSIGGFDPEEIRMRQRCKALAKSARTVSDVVTLLKGTYFNADFQNEDGSARWDDFNPDDLTVTRMKKVKGGWQGNEGSPVKLTPEARVRHVASGEDIHLFVILEPPVVL